MDFSAFDTKKMDEYAKEAKESWGQTDAYKEYEEKTKGQSKEQMKDYGIAMMDLFVNFGNLMSESPDSEIVQKQVKMLQDYITEHFYNCTPQILKGLGQMYVADERFRKNIDKAGGEGAAEFVKEAIEIYCK